MTTTAITLKGDPQIFKVGATVTAYLRSNWSTADLPPSGAPKGSSAASATVGSDGTIALTGLTAGERYYAVVDLNPGGSHDYHYMQFTVGDSSDLDPGLPVSTDVLHTYAASQTYVDGLYRAFKRGAARLRASDLTGPNDALIQDGGAVALQTASATNPFLLYLDPAIYPKIRVAAGCLVNDTAPGGTLTFGLYPVGTPSGGSQVINPNFGTVVPGTTIAFATPAANSKSAETVNAAITCPVAGWYGLGVNVSATPAANSMVVIPYRFEYKVA